MCVHVHPYHPDPSVVGQDSHPCVVLVDTPVHIHERPSPLSVPSVVLQTIEGTTRPDEGYGSPINDTPKFIIQESVRQTGSEVRQPQHHDVREHTLTTLLPFPSLYLSQSTMTGGPVLRKIIIQVKVLP